MSAVLAALGWKALVALGALAAAGAAWLLSVRRAKARGIDQQRWVDEMAIEAQKRSAARIDADVANMSPEKIHTVLQEEFGRKP